jgi:hypothetical protein
MSYVPATLLVVSCIADMCARASLGCDVPATFWWLTSATIACSLATILMHRTWLRDYQGWTPLWLSLLAVPCQFGGLALHFGDAQYRAIYIKTFATCAAAIGVVAFVVRRAVF